MYLFNAPPGPEDVGVSAPLFGDLDEAPDELILHVEEQDASETVGNRIVELSTVVGLTPAELRRFSGLSIDTIREFRSAFETAIAERADLFWAGYPSYNQIGVLMRIVCSVRSPP